MFYIHQRYDRSLTFRRFSRKGYALFACMGREVRIGVLSAATLLSAAPRLAAATPGAHLALDSLPADTLRLAESVVRAERPPRPQLDAVRRVQVFTRHDLEVAGVASVNDLLKQAAGVDVRQRGGFGVQTDISINGGTFDQIALFVNGVSVSNPQTGHNAADFPLNLSDILRVEVLEGAAARLLGSGAFSGAVNVVTRSGGERLRASVAGGSYGTLGAEASTAWTPGPFATSASLSYMRSDGAVPATDFDRVKAYWSGRYEGGAVRLSAQAGFTGQRFGASTFYSAAWPDQWEATRRTLLSLRAETTGPVGLYVQGSWLRSTDHYQLTRGSSEGENFNRGDVTTLSAGLTLPWAGGHTTLGAELRREDLLSSNLGRPLPEGDERPVSGHDGRFYTRSDGRTHTAFFLDHRMTLGAWTLSAGVTAQRNSWAGERFGFYPGVDVGWRPAPRWSLTASWNRALRLPTFTDLYYKSPTLEGNTGLRPERCDAFRVTGSYVRPWLDVALSAWYNRGDGLIDWAMYAPDDVYHATSFDLDTWGLGAAATLRADVLWGEAQPLRRLRVDYAWMRQHRRDAGPVFRSNYALEYLRHKLTLSLDHRLWSRLGAVWSLRMQDRAGAWQRYRNGRPTGELVPYGLYALLDCRLSWTEPAWELTLDLTNLTARRCYDLGGVRQPGFLLMAGATWRLP